MPTAGSEGNGRRAAVMELLGLVVLIAAQVPFAFGSEAPLDSDYGRIFLGPLFQVRDALLDCRLLFWDRIRFGGTPYWALPNTAPAYPPLLAALLLFQPVVATNLMIVVHLLVGAWGTRALARRLGASRAPAFVAAATYLFAPAVLLYARNQPWAVMGLAYLPWTLLVVVQNARGADWRACGLAAGLLHAGVTWCGGYVIFLPGLVATGLSALLIAWRRPFPRELVRTAGMLAVFLVTLVGAAAGRLLPSTAWTELTDRAEGLDLRTTIGDAFRLGDLGLWTAGTGLLTLALAAVGIGAAVRARRTVELSFALVALLLVTLTLGWPQRWLLLGNLPGFDRVRDPRHFWAPLSVLVPVLVAGGLQTWIDRRGRGARRPRVPAAFLATLALVVALGAETRAWGLVREERILSLTERLEANALHQELARRAAVEPRFRVHDARDTRPKLKRTADLVRCALGLESIEGLLGNISIPDYDLDFIVPSRKTGPRLWGCLNCVYVTSEEELLLPALELVGVFAEDPDELSPGSDGPYLYRNRRALPRAYLSHRAILLLGATLPERQHAACSPSWDPTREILVRASRSDLSRREDPFALFDLVVCGAGARGDAQLRAAIAQAGADVRPLVPPELEQDPQLAWPASSAPPILPLADPEPAWNRAEVELGDVAQDAWLVLAETYAIYPGWTARVDGVPTPMWIANGAATAIPVKAGARKVVLTYVPPLLPVGLGISAATIAVAALALLLLSRRRARAPV